MSLPPDQIRELLYSSGRSDRFTQDSPVLPDVWAEFARNPDLPVDLLLTPFQAPGTAPLSPAVLAQRLIELLRGKEARAPGYQRKVEGVHDVAANQTTVAVKLWFDELVRVVLPMSAWWQSRIFRSSEHGNVKLVDGVLAEMTTAVGRTRLADRLSNLDEVAAADFPPDLYWMILVVGAITASNQRKTSNGRKSPQLKAWPIPKAPAQRKKYLHDLLEIVVRLLNGINAFKAEKPLVYLVSRNRPATTSLYRSVPAVKADAAVNLFNIDCKEITWAVVDSGIDAGHPAFRRRDPNGNLKKIDREADWSAESRVTATYDFTLIRRILSTNHADAAALDPKLKRVLKKSPETRKEIRERLTTGREIDWQLLLPYIQVPHDNSYRSPVHDHGTHVAGILGADWRPSDSAGGLLDVALSGICPNINLLDVRILDDRGQGDEFSVMAALQFIRYLNSHKDFLAVHGANLSLSILHDVANYACGRTPVCDESDRLVASGVVVVAAAGNEGFRRDLGGAMGGDYRAISITDPGNAESVITVGATHRDMPHTYGVSYFSSRGPTGDGRLKPDLVAPGEKIDSLAPNEGLARKDGTSMAAPHVSGAAALLIARHREFIGQPARVKQVLCASATDLGRERYFQGCGMLDVLRALQNV